MDIFEHLQKMNEQEEKIDAFWSRERVEEELLNPLAVGIQAIRKNYYYAAQKETEDGVLVYEYYSPDGPKIEVHVDPNNLGAENV